MESEAGASSAASSSIMPPAAAGLAAKQRDGRKTASTTPAFLSNLGRATLRGIRRCPQCGVYNGTRGLSCKNKACGISLRNASAAGRSGKSGAVEVVKVIIDSEERGGKERPGGGAGAGVLGAGSGGGGVQVFSVSHRGRGASQLGFVELVPTDTAIATGDGATLLTRINLGRCFLPACAQGQRSNRGDSEAAASPKQSSDSICAHIKQAIECRSCATPLTLKSSVLEGLQASIQAKEELWRLATESPGPLVQRVAKDTLVVKCHPDSKHPLGLLHLTVGGAGLSEGSKAERRSREVQQQQQQAVFHCACQLSGRRGKAAAAGNHHPPPGSSAPQPCLHFYACVCAFASDEKLAAEFAAFVNYANNGAQQQSAVLQAASPVERQQAEALKPHKAKKPRAEDPLSVASPSGVGKQGVSASGPRSAGARKAPGAGGPKAPGSAQVVDEHSVTLGFHQWLASVTERIHQTMHYQFNGKPEPLVYHVPQEFFNALQHRLSLGSKKRRLPNFTTAFVRSDGLPLGSKYTWHITSLTQVKRIFDTPELPLELTQSFVRNMDGSYSRFRCPEPPPEPEPAEGSRSERPQAIRPMELRTFLKAGPSSDDQKDAAAAAAPFVIEWIPDVLPRCQVGELRIAFEFGHQQSGQPEPCEKTAEKGGRHKPDSAHSKLAKAELLQALV